jgi:hypothetical protein
MKKLIVLLCLFQLVLLVGCFDDAIKEAVRQLDNLEQTFNNKSGDLTTELENWRKQLPDEVHALIDDDVQKLATNIIGSTGAETRCTVDFLRDRFKQSIKNIERRLLKQPIVYEKPCFCTVDQPALNPNDELKTIETIKLYGYDFNNLDPSKKPMQAVLVGDGGISKPIDEKFIGRTTNYAMVIDVADILPDIASNKYNKIKFLWNGDSKGMSEILILKWLPENLITSFQPRSFSWFPPHTGGDGDLDTKQGNWANGQIEIQFRVQENMLQARLFYDVMEFGGDNTRFGVNGNGEASAWGPWNTLYTNDDPHYDLIGYSPSAPDRYHFSVFDQGAKDYFQAGSSVLKFVAYVDQKGDDVGYCHVDVLFNPMDAILKRKQPK